MPVQDGGRDSEREGIGEPDELGHAGEPVLVEVVDGTVVQELTRQEQRSVRVRAGTTGVGRRTGWGQRRGGGAAFPPHQTMQGRGLLLVPRRAGGGVGGRRRGTTGASADRNDGERLERREQPDARRASDMDTVENHTRLAGERFRHTPTWRTKCRISGSGRPLRFELWGAHEDLSPTSSCLEVSQRI